MNYRMSRQFRVPRSRQYGLVLGLGVLLAVWLAWLSPTSGLAQLPIPTAPATEEPPTTAPTLRESLESITPPSIQTLLLNNRSDLVTAPVRLDGRTVFLVAAPVFNDEAGGSMPLSARQRAHEIERRLQSIIQQGIQPESLAVIQNFDTQSNQPIIEVNGEFLVTVTSLDAQLHGSTYVSLRAIEIVDSVDNALRRYYAERQIPYLRRQGTLAALLIGLMGVLHLGISYGQVRLKRRSQALAEASVAADPIPTQEAPQSQPTTALRQQCREQERRGFIDLGRALLKIAQVANGGVGIYILLGLFPYTRWLQSLMLGLLKLPITVGVLVLSAYWLIRLGAVWIDRIFIVLQEGATLTPKRSQRLELRFSTFSQVVKGLLYFLIGLATTLVGLSLFGVRLGPLLTGAGLIGLAFSLASQNLIRDFINGFLILLEDQYGVGDVIMVEGVWGFVETLNLRITQLRNEEGRLITIPNSHISIVQNLSKEWSRVDLTIPVALTANINSALQLVEQVANAMHNDAIWGHLILEPPLLLGVDQLDHVGAAIRIWIKTQPLKQWDVAREYRRRLKLAFEDAHIDIGIPQQVIHISSQNDRSLQHDEQRLRASLEGSHQLQ